MQCCCSLNSLSSCCNMISFWWQLFDKSRGKEEEDEEEETNEFNLRQPERSRELRFGQESSTAVIAVSMLRSREASLFDLTVRWDSFRHWLTWRLSSLGQERRRIVLRFVQKEASIYRRWLMLTELFGAGSSLLLLFSGILRVVREWQAWMDSEESEWHVSCNNASREHDSMAV